MRILLVEDNIDTLRLLSRLLRGMGHDVRPASSVQEARRQASSEFDLLISDIGLPDGSGWELMRQLRALQPVRGVALSGFSTEQDIQRSRDAGFLAHLTKPIDIKKLDAVIAGLASRAPAPGEHPAGNPPSDGAPHGR
jgi:CheY-like chemotaxis protein